ncbi:MAG: oligoendopeptidase F [Planctomycetes bacterium]|nr:oligoendopeptidase F [Planctomycetota bacterium]MBI3835736.1 oligoendopeptidase F [Planctomycetota bacterium]
MSQSHTLLHWKWTTMMVLVLGPVAGPAWAEEKEKKVPERSEIEKKYTWATENIFPDVKAWEAEYAALEKGTKDMAAHKGMLKNGADQLLKVLKAKDDIEARVDRVNVYASLTADQDTREGAAQALKSRAQTLAVNYSQAMSWFQPELTAMSFDQIDSWMRENKDLAQYRQYFDNLFRQKKHILSPREEELLAMAGEVNATPYNAYNLLANADIKFPSIKDAEGKTTELSDSAFYVMMSSPDRRVRKDAYDAIVGGYAGHRNTAAALLNGVVQAHIFNMKARGYPSCLTASLDAGNIPVEAYNNLVKTVDDNLPLLHRYTELRKRVLKLADGTHDYDLYCPLIIGQSPEYTYEKGVEAMNTALKPLGADYLANMQKGLDSRWVDVFPTRGKRSGAYSSGTFLTQPYMLLNFHGQYSDVSTLAHEMGHSMHSYFSRKTQPYVYSDYDIFCAEVASTCNEILLQNYVLAHAKDTKEKLYLISEFLERMRGTIFRQTMFSEFEQRVHEMAEKGQPLTADTLGAAYGEIMKKYYGPSYVHDPIVDNYWARIPHFYYNFYVYKYATSYCAASNIAARIEKEGDKARDAYIGFLKGGSSKYPIDLLKGAGVDMTSPEPIRDGLKLFGDLLDQAEAAMKELGML